MATSVNQKEVVKPTKWEVVYEDEDSISIWRYNSKITTSGPVEVETLQSVESKEKDFG
jgi:hypothetical protein